MIFILNEYHYKIKEESFIMKKALSVLCAAVLAFSVAAMPAFAAATDGQAENTLNKQDQIFAALNAGDTTSAKNALTELTTLSASNPLVSKTTAELASAVLSKTGADVAVASSVEGVTATATVGDGASDITLNQLSVTYTADEKPAITLDASMAAQSAQGVRMNITVPHSVLSAGGSIRANDWFLTYTAEDGTKQLLQTVLSVSVSDAGYTITFWVPHFSTYVLTTDESYAPELPAPPTPTPTPGPTNPDTEGGSTPSGTAAPTTAPVANPIKATGADMSTAVVFLAVAAVVALAGGMVVVKKSGMN